MIVQARPVELRVVLGLVLSIAPSLACGGAAQTAEDPPPCCHRPDPDVDASIPEAGPDALLLPPLACSLPTRIGGTDYTPSLAATGSGGKVTVVWTESRSGTGDFRGHLRARQLDGTAWLDPVDLGLFKFTDLAWLVSDTTGRGYLQWVSPDGPWRSVLDIQAGSFGTPTPFGAVKVPPNDRQATSLARTPDGAISVFTAVDGVRAARWGPASGDWDTSAVLSPSADTVHVKTNATGQAVVLSYATPRDPL
jgi:hypothetical protein